MPFSESIPKGRKPVNPVIQLNVLKCILSIRRTKTEKTNIFFYEILSPAGLFASGIAFSPDDDEKSKKINVEVGAEEFLSFTEELSTRQDAFGKLLSPSVLSSLDRLLGEILTAEAVREALENPRDNMKTLEECLREEISSRLGYRATAYLKADRRGEETLTAFLKKDGAVLSSEDANKESAPKNISFLVPCAPYIDPVKGTPVASLQKGDFVLVRLPEDEAAPIREKLQRADPDFDGTVRGEVISVHKDRHGNFTLLVRLSDEFNGVTTLEGNSRIRTAPPVQPATVLPGTTANSKEKEGTPALPQPSPGDTPGWVYFFVFGAMATLVVILFFIRNFL
jgi:hypothetical protein